MTPEAGQSDIDRALLLSLEAKTRAALKLGDGRVDLPCGPTLSPRLFSALA